MPRRSIWDDDAPNPYGTYEGEPGNPDQWRNSARQAVAEREGVSDETPPHEVLGIDRDASVDTIKTQFRRLAKVTDPDKGGDAAKMQDLTDAYSKMIARNSPPKSTTTKIIPQLLTPIRDEADLERYLNDDRFGAQEKKDGHHNTLQILGDRYICRNKKGDASAGGMPEFENALKAIGQNLLVDGEHIGTRFWVWDILELGNQNLRTLPYIVRHRILSDLNFGPEIQILPLARTREEKRRLYENLKRLGKEGIVFKRLDAAFTPGKGMDQLKYKFYESVSVIVVPGRPGRASIGMELYNRNGREFVGYCTCVLNPLPAPGSIAEIKYLYAYRGGRIYQPAFKELRDDVDPEECTTAQLKYKSEDDNPVSF